VLPSAPRPELDAGDDTLFTVYAKEDANRFFGIAQRGAKGIVIDGEPGAFKVRTAQWLTAVGEISKRLRQGFSPTGGAWFYNPRSLRFTRIHPDMDWKGAQVVLLSRQPDLPAAVDLVATAVRATPATCITGEEIVAWQQQQLRNVAHVVAFDDHPAWALALAELVYAKGWDWRVGPKLSAPPSKRPSQSPWEWAGWLQQRFDPKAIQQAQTGFGWTVDAQLISDSASPERASLSALL